MDITFPFEFAAASVKGAEHARRGKNNQDAFELWVSGSMAVGLVADGCGSSPHSEFGARLAVKALGASLVKALEESCSGTLTRSGFATLLEASRQELLGAMARVIPLFGPDSGKALRECFLCTIVGFMISPSVAATFSLGDGLVALNGEILPLGPFPGNEPPYLGYEFLEWPGKAGKDLRFVVHHFVPVESLQHLVIASDGLNERAERSDGHFPETGALEQSSRMILSELWTDSSFFRNPDSLRRLLFKANQETPVIDWENRRLKKKSARFADDTTIIVARRVRLNEPGDGGE